MHTWRSPDNVDCGLPLALDIAMHDHVVEARKIDARPVDVGVSANVDWWICSPRFIAAGLTLTETLKTEGFRRYNKWCTRRER